MFLAFVSFIVVRYSDQQKNKADHFPLKERQGAIALLQEWAVTKTNGDKLLQTVTDKPEDIKSKITLASIYIQEARITGDYDYYDAAAMKYINDALAIEPNHYEALILKAIIQLTQHHFSEALETAALAQKINPYNAFIYGIMVDGNVEMGNYAAAVEHSDKMMSIRPDIRSYSRVSYLREIHGDLPGAIEAMKMAVDAGGYGDEGTAWARIELAKLYEKTGEIKFAEMHYTIALNERPGYSHALAGMARIAIANKEFQKAVQLYGKADSLMNDFSFKEELAELYLFTGEQKKADGLMNTIIADLNKTASKGEEAMNHHADKELASLYLLKKDYDRAVKYALAEYSRHPDNISVNEILAWAYFKKGDAQKALPFMEKALKTGIKNPASLCKAGFIYAAAGQKEKAKTALTVALKSNPVMEPGLKKECQILLNSL